MLFPIVLCSIWVCLFLAVCGKKPQKELDVIIVESDTIPTYKFNCFFSDTTLVLKRKKQFTAMVTMAKHYPRPVDTLLFKEIVVDLNDQLSRESGRSWSKEAAENLYGASKDIQKKLESATDAKALQAYLDSFANKITLPSDSTPFSFSLNNDINIKDTSHAERKKQLSSIMSSLFYTDKQLSDIVSEFAYSEDVSMINMTQVSDLIKGLVFDSAAASRKKKKKIKRVAVQRENSALALKYRTQQSIQGTISEHTPFLEAIYKKELKKNPNMSGVVYVTFRVASSGEVISAAIKSSQINNNDFLNPLLDYIKKINFLAIPENVGIMTFDFPFEFNQEL